MSITRQTLRVGDRNTIFERVSKLGLDPGDFEWTEETSTRRDERISVLRLKPRQH